MFLCDGSIEDPVQYVLRKLKTVHTTSEAVMKDGDSTGLICDTEPSVQQKEQSAK